MAMNMRLVIQRVRITNVVVIPSCELANSKYRHSAMGVGKATGFIRVLVIRVTKASGTSSFIMTQGAGPMINIIKVIRSSGACECSVFVCV